MNLVKIHVNLCQEVIQLDGYLMETLTLVTLILEFYRDIAMILVLIPLTDVREIQGQRTIKQLGRIKMMQPVVLTVLQIKCRKVMDTSVVVVHLVNSWIHLLEAVKNVAHNMVVRHLSLDWVFRLGH